MNILFFDLETAPMSGNFWRPKTEYIPHEQLIEDSFLLTWGAKWRGQTMQSDWLTPQEIAERNDVRIVESMAKLAREADFVVAHNARRFDVPRLNARLLLNVLEPLPPFRVLDTLEIARKSFGLPYFRLDYISQVLLGHGKLDTDFELWKQVMLGNEVAMRRMVRYNRKDVRLLEQVFEAIVPYAKGLPRLVRAKYDGEFACPTCGSHDLQRRGTYDTNAASYQQWQCNRCQRYSSEPKHNGMRLALRPR